MTKRLRHTHSKINTIHAANTSRLEGTRFQNLGFSNFLRMGFLRCALARAEQSSFASLSMEAHVMFEILDTFLSRNTVYKVIRILRVRRLYWLPKMSLDSTMLFPLSFHSALRAVVASVAHYDTISLHSNFFTFPLLLAISFSSSAKQGPSSSRTSPMAPYLPTRQCFHLNFNNSKHH